MKTCDFCSRDKMKKYVVDEDKDWYAFVPQEPEIFGHIILTTDKGSCTHDMQDVDEKILQAEILGIRQMMRKLHKIDNVGRVYVVVAGESLGVHHHFHLLPRYEFKSSEDRKKWAQSNEIKAEDPKWVEFYRWSTSDFSHKEGFQYLGEIERKYNEYKNNEYYPNIPSDDLRLAMVDKLKAIFK
nr:HIT domain-containing protein [Candidatus Freyarchaeota archaeon]